MSVQVNMAEAKARLSELVSLAEAGQIVIIARAGRPAAELRVVATAGKKPKHRRIGALAHLGALTQEEATLFLEPDPELERLARSEDEDEFYR
jgi:antitoxin (DNA-binding transcriptional repressor) of toxin-antitoxin stability system